jgi:FKBP12-rapamycin complex-associated protein
MGMSRYVEVSEMIFRFKESRDVLIRRSVIQILPKLALFSPDEFVDSHAHTSLQFLLDQLKVDRFRTVGM